MTPTEAQKKVEEIQIKFQKLEVEKSLAQEKVQEASLEQQKLTTELNTIIYNMSQAKANPSGLTLPGNLGAKGFKLN